MNVERIVVTVCLAVFALQFGCDGSEDPQPAAEATPPQIVEPITQAPAVEIERPPVAGTYDGEDAAFLTLNSKPWSTVFLDGEMLRNTPIKDWKIAPGSHTLVLRCGNCNPPQEKTEKFTVDPGATHISVRNEFAQTDR
jgi:hypothetical protein